MSSECQSILVVEDDASIRIGLVDALQFSGYKAFECETGDKAVQAAQEFGPDLILLDVLLPGRNGFEILAELRRINPVLPIIMLTAKGADADRVAGLRGGADDYVVKPFSIGELLARIEAVLRRSPGRSVEVSCIDAGDRTIDLQRREVSFQDGQTCQLSERETGILNYLCANPGRAIDRNELLMNVWGLNPRGLTTRTVDMHIARLRDKLRDSKSARPLIITVRSKGYMIAEDMCATPAKEPQ